MRFLIGNMECEGCLRGVIKAIHGIEPQAVVDADLPARCVRVVSDRPGQDFLPALQAAGFPAKLLQDASS